MQTIANIAHESYGLNNIFTDVVKLGSQAVKIAAFSLTNVLRWFSVIGNLTFKLFLYFTIVYLLVGSKTAALEYALSFVPTEGNVRNSLLKSLEEKINGIFTSVF